MSTAGDQVQPHGSFWGRFLAWLRRNPTPAALACVVVVQCLVTVAISARYSWLIHDLKRENRELRGEVERLKGR